MEVTFAYVSHSPRGVLLAGTVPITPAEDADPHLVRLFLLDGAVLRALAAHAASWETTLPPRPEDWARIEATDSATRQVRVRVPHSLARHILRRQIAARKAQEVSGEVVS